MSTTAVKLTPKQQQVIDGLDRGEAPPAIAKKMRISASGVYGHIRNIRKLGVVIPGESLGTNGDGPADPPAPPLVGDSSGAAAQPDGDAGSPEPEAEAFLEGKIKHAQTTVETLDKKHAELTASLAETEAAKAAALDRIAKLDAALQALA